jgi:hypothetical protein
MGLGCVGGAGAVSSVGSRWGAKNGFPGYDSFRTGLKFADVKRWARSESENPKDWRYSRRGTVLGMWHAYKLQLYEEAVRRGYPETTPSATDGVAPRNRRVPSVRPSPGNPSRRPRIRSANLPAQELPTNNKLRRKGQR